MAGTAVAEKLQPDQKHDPLIEEMLLAAKTPEQRKRIFEISSELEHVKLVRKMARLVAATTWGAALTPQMAYSYSRYCLAIGADPTRHVDILGGSPFINGDYYRD